MCVGVPVGVIVGEGVVVDVDVRVGVDEGVRLEVDVGVRVGVNVLVCEAFFLVLFVTVISKPIGVLVGKGLFCGKATCI